jgi:hypothetical protein
MSALRAPTSLELTDAATVAAARGQRRARGPSEEREHLLERLQNLRKILPVFATELASARRQAAQLRVENKRLVEHVRRLQATAASDDPGARQHGPGRRQPTPGGQSDIGSRPQRRA